MPQKLPPRTSPRNLSRRYGVRSKGSPADRAVWDLTYEKPANLEALTGSEGINNADITINANGTLSGAGSGQVTLGGLGAGSLATANEVDNSTVAAGAEIRLSKLYYPQKTQASSESANWNSGAGVIRLTRGSGNTEHVIFEKTFSNVSATNLVFFNGSVLVTPSEQTPGTVDDATTTTVTAGKWILKESSSSGTGGTVLAQGNINYSTQPGGWQSNNTATDSFQEALNKVYTLSNTGTVYVKLIYQFTSGNLADIADFGSNTAFRVTGALGIDD